MQLGHSGAYTQDSTRLKNQILISIEIIWNHLGIFLYANPVDGLTENRFSTYIVLSQLELFRYYCALRLIFRRD